MWLMGEHLPFGLLADLAEGRAEPTADERAHLAACERCAADLAWLERLVSLRRDSPGDEPPADAVGRIKALFRERRRRAPAARRLIHAVVRFDSAHSAPAFGLRAGVDLTRQILLSAGGYDVDLRIAPADGRWALTGQLLPIDSAPPAAGTAELLGAAGSVAAELSELSEFALPPVRAGRYNLTISLRGGVIVVPSLELGT